LNRDRIVTNLVLGGGTELSLEFNDTAFPMATDIEGNALASKRIKTKYFMTAHGIRPARSSPQPPDDAQPSRSNYV